MDTTTQIFPLLPEKLSTDLTSLNEATDRLAVVVEMVIDPAGSLVGSEVYRARVHNQAKLAYQRVAAWLDGTQPAPPRVATVPGLADQLRLQDRVAQRLKQLRHQSGALSLKTPDARPVFSADRLTQLAVDQRNRAKGVIADFMIAANGVTARYLASKGFPSFRRVLGAPARWGRIMALATAVGERLPAAPESTALEAFLSRRHQVDPLHAQNPECFWPPSPQHAPASPLFPALAPIWRRWPWLRLRAEGLVHLPAVSAQAAVRTDRCLARPGHPAPDARKPSPA